MGAGYNLIEADVLVSGWLEGIRQRNMRNSRGVSATKLKVSGTIILHLCMIGARSLVNIIVVCNSLIHVLWWTVGIDSSIKSICPAVRKFLHYHFLPVSIYMVSKAGSGAEMNKSDSCKEVTEYLALFVKPTWCGPKYATDAWQVVPKAVCEL